MANGGFKLTKVRTFRDDFARAQLKAGDDANATTTKAPSTNEPVAVKSAEPVTTPQPKAIPEPKPVTKMPVSPQLREASRPIEMTPQKMPVPKTAPANPPAPKGGSELDVDLEGVKKEGKTSLMSSGGKHFNVMEAESESGEGNIITDQKRKRFKLLPAMAEAFKGWIGDTTETMAEIAHPKEEGPRLKPATERKGLLMKAAESSAQAPRDDYRTVAERVAKTGRKPVTSKSALSIKKRSEVPPPSWTHVKGEEDEVAEVETQAEEIASEEKAPEVAPKPEPATSQSVKPTPEVKPAPVATPAPVAEVPPPTPAQSETVAPPTPTEPPAPVIPTPEPVVEGPAKEIETPAPVPATPEPEPPAPREPAPQAAPAKAPVVAPYQAPGGVGSRGDAMVFSPWRVGAVAVAAVLLGVSASVWLFGGSGDSTVVRNQQAATELVRAEEQIAVPLGNSAGDLLRNLQTVRPKPTTVVAQIYPTSNIAGDTEPASAADIMATLNPQAPSSFVRAVTDINFGLYRDQEPFIVLRVTSFDTAFGGMLEWEGSMSADLSPFFGAPVSGTFDPQARSATQIRDPYFIDAVVSNLDVRLLTDETQKERLIYSFVNRNTVLVTTNRDALKALANVIR